MPNLVPVEHDPFVDQPLQFKLVGVDHDPFAGAEFTPNQYVDQNFPPQEIPWAQGNSRIKSVADPGATTAREVLHPFVYLHGFRGVHTSRKDGDAIDFDPRTWLAPSRYRLPENI